ncbi:MAG: hypothetical protein MPJ50_04970 [Pirellulales bacterium]|nr:hypothetical protein [Pirellulales bacterium]
MRRQAQLVWLLGLALSVSVLGGCARFPLWDTTQGVPTYVSPPGPLVTGSAARDVRIVVNPAEQVVPVGSEVALVASVCIAGQMASNQPVNWTLEGVGELRGAGGFGESNALNPLLWPQITSSTVGQSTTFPQSAVVTRGTQQTGDDFLIQKGQTWMSLSSQQEGTSVVTTSAPSLLDPSSGQAIARVHWIDAQWAFPQSTTAGLGASVPLTTTVIQPSTGAPARGYLVRYEISGGSAAGFAPDGAQVREVVTDSNGAATVDLIQGQPAMGTTNVQIQIVRDVPQPPTSEGAQQPSPRVILGRSSLSVTWTSDVTINLSGPSQVAAGAESDFTIDIANPGDEAVPGSRVTLNVPEGWTIVGTDPVAMQSGNEISFDLGDLAAGSSQSLVVRFQVASNLTAELCAELNSTNGATIRDCLRTSVASAALDVTLRRTQPRGGVSVGDQVTWEITVLNRGNAATPSGLVITDTYDAGLQHEIGQNPIARDLDPIVPGKLVTFPVTFTAVAVGQACQHVTVSNEETGELFGEGRDCVQIARAVTPARRELAVRKTGPLTAKVGDTPTFRIEVTNTGEATLRNVRVVDSYETGLRPIQASEGNDFTEPPGEYRLTWIVDELGPGQFARFDVQCACERVATDICGRVTVESEDGTKDNDELCLNVRPDKLPMTVTIVETRDPVVVGTDVTYEVSIKNESSVTETQIQLDFDLATGMTLNEIATRSPRGTRDHQLDGDVIRFNPMPELRPQETLRYTIRARVSQPGENRVRAVVSGGSLRHPLEISESTTVNDRQP